MLWFFLALLAAFFISIANILDKHVISDEMKHPLVGASMAGFTLFVFFSLFSLFSDPLSLPPVIIIFSFLGGMCYNLALFFYYKTAQSGEISRVVPAFKLDVVFVLLFSFLFLGEVLTLFQYGGVILLIGGTVLITYKKKAKKLRSSILWLAIMTALFLSIRNFLVGFTSDGNLFAVLSWVGLGGLLVGSIFFAAHHPHIRKKGRKGIEHLFLTNALAIAFFFLFSQSIALSSASLATAVVSAQIFFVFIIAIALSKTHTHIIKEELRESTLLLKGVAIVMIFLGLLFIL